MLRSLYSAISGLRNHQIRMDVIGNNIANVNTIGFKRSQVTFSTMLSQTMRGASAPDTSTPPNYGGTNAIQVGLGMNLGAITQVMSQGSSQYTGSDTNMMIQGNGFFVLRLSNGNNVYTRAGAFVLDSQGYLVDPATGALVLGYRFQNDNDDPTWDPTSLEPIKIKIGMDRDNDPELENVDIPNNYKLESFSIDQNGVITGIFVDPNDNNASETHIIAQIAIANFANPSGLMSVGNNYYQETNNSGKADIGAPGSSGRGVIIPNAVEMSNVDLSQEFTDMIVTQRGFQANSRVITVSDTLLEELVNLKR